MDKALIPTLYASTIDIRTSETELVLEFGSHVKDPANPVAEPKFQPQVRIVVPLKGALDLSNAIMQEAQKRQQASTSGTAQTGPLPSAKAK